MPPLAPPTIDLVPTLAALYAPNTEAHELVVLVAYCPSMVDARARRYVYHDIDEMLRAVAPASQKSDRPKANYARIMRLIGAQRLCICAGRMPFVGFGEAEGDDKDERMVGQARSLAEAALEVLPPAQRPTLLFFDDPAGVELDHPDPRLVVRLPADALAAFPHVLHPDVHYELLSKRGLALSGLVTPACKLIDLDGDLFLRECVDDPKAQRARNGGSAAMEQWVVKAITLVTSEPLPFVLKLQQTTFGKGTFIVKTESDRSQLLAVLPAMLEYNLRSTNESNLHLKAASLVITEYIACSNPASFAVTFFVNRDGSHVFVGCAKQDLEDDSSSWAGASISYLDQDRLQQHFAATVADVARFLHLRGYYGTVGIDVLEDDFGTQWVVDLNVRPPGSLVLSLLRAFLSDARGLHDARLVASTKCDLPRDALVRALAPEFAESRVILVGWVDDLLEGGAWMSLVVSGESPSRVSDLLDRIYVLAAAGEPCYNGL